MLYGSDLFPTEKELAASMVAADVLIGSSGFHEPCRGRERQLQFQKCMLMKRLNFPKSRRLTRAAEFEQVKKNGHAERGGLLLLSVYPVSEVAPFRAGFITSRAIGRAVVRNRVRRRLREIVRKHQHEIADGNWIVTIARTSAAAASYQQLEAEWLRLAKRASILAP